MAPAGKHKLQGKSVEYLEAVEKLRLADQLIHLKDKAKLMGVESPTVLGDLTIMNINDGATQDQGSRTPAAQTASGDQTEASLTEEQSGAKSSGSGWKKKAAIAAALLAGGLGTAGTGAAIYSYLAPTTENTTVISESLGLEVEVERGQDFQTKDSRTSTVRAAESG